MGKEGRVGADALKSATEWTEAMDDLKSEVNAPVGLMGAISYGEDRGLKTTAFGKR